MNDTSGSGLEWDLSTAGGGQTPPPPPSQYGAKKEKVPAQSQDIFSMIDFASLLRFAGALTVIAAMSAFLMQDWADVTDNSRYYMLLAQTALLTLAGFGLSFLMKENKGARVFFGLGLLSIVANMATLGALIYSVTQWSGALGDYPGFAHWRAVDEHSLLMAVGAGIAVAVPTALFGFMVLARASSRKLAAMFLFTNAMMLLPLRDSSLVGLVAMLGLLLPLVPLSKMLREDSSLRTKEGWFALSAVFAPMLIVIGRELALYSLDDVTTAVLAFTGFVLVRELVPGEEKAGQFPGGISMILAMLTALQIADAINMSSIISGAVFCLIYGLMGVDVIQRQPQSRTAFAWLTALPIIFCQSANFVGSNQAFALVPFVVAGLAVAGMGRIYAVRGMYLSGVAMLGIGLLTELRRIVEYVDFSHWMALAILGATAIIAASVIERHGAVLKMKWQKLGEREDKPLI